MNNSIKLVIIHPYLAENIPWNGLKTEDKFVKMRNIHLQIEDNYFTSGLLIFNAWINEYI